MNEASFPPSGKIVAWIPEHTHAGCSLTLAQVAMQLVLHHQLRVLIVDPGQLGENQASLFEINPKAPHALFQTIPWPTSTTVPTIEEKLHLITANTLPDPDHRGRLRLLLAPKTSVNSDTSPISVKEPSSYPWSDWKSQLKSHADVILLDLSSCSEKIRTAYTTFLAEGCVVVMGTTSTNHDALDTLLSTIDIAAKTSWILWNKLPTSVHSTSKEPWVQAQQTWFQTRCDRSWWSTRHHAHGTFSYSCAWDESLALGQPSVQEANCGSETLRGCRLLAASIAGYFWGEHSDIAGEIEDPQMVLEQVEPFVLLAEERLDSDTLAVLLLYQGCAARELGKYRLSLASLSRAAGIFLHKQDLYSFGLALHELGSLLFEEQAYEDARSELEKALQLREKLKDERGQATTLHELGRVSLAEEKFEEALTHYQASLAIDRKLGNRPGQAVTLHDIGRLHAEKEEIELALTMYQQALELAISVGDREGEAATLFEIGRAYFQQGETEQAKKLILDSIAIAEEVGDTEGQALAHFELGQINASIQEWPSARKSYRASADICSQRADIAGEIDALTELSHLLVDPLEQTELERIKSRLSTLETELSS
jgi:tetratricopeptide (TPR) repeat protein